MNFLQRLSFACLAALVFAFPASAQIETPLSPDEAFALTVAREADGDLSFVWAIAPGYYLYREHTAAAVAHSAAPLPLDLAKGRSKDDPDFGVVDIWRDIGRAVMSADTLAQAGAPSSISITYQGCLEDSICYPPTTQTVTVPARPKAHIDTPEGDAEIVPTTALVAVAPDASVVSPTANSVTSVAATASAVLPAKAKDDSFVGRLALKGGAAWVLAAFLGFGVLLAFTPCVLPMYPILAGVIGRGADGRGSRRGLVLSVAYVLGLSSALALLGVAAAWSGQNLQMALQSAWAVGAVAVIFVVLAISTFGAFTLQLPSAWTSRLSRDDGHGRRTLLSAAGLGFVSALIVGPCVTAPLAGALLYIAQTGDILLGAAALFFLGLGKGLPLIAFGTAGARFLPKAGPWMDRVKMVFGFVFLAMAWWLASRILPPAATLALGAALALALAAALGLFSPATTRPSSRLGRAAGLAAATWGVLLLGGLSLGAVDPWRPLAPLTRPSPTAAVAAPQPAAVVVDQPGLDRALAAASARQRPALVYFTADWCVSCRVMERRVFQNQDVVARLTEVDLIQVDLTRSTPETRAMMKRYLVAGPPTLIFMSRSATEAPDTRLVGETSVQPMLDALKRAGAAA